MEIAIAKFYTSAMRFDWDANKAASNLINHRVSFEEAATVFSDPLSQTFNDPDHSITERRFIIIGTSEQGQLLDIIGNKPRMTRSARRR